MDNLARPEPQGDFGASFVRGVETNGSLAAVHPLEEFLAESRDLSALRSTGKLARVALIADIAHFMCVSHGRHPGVVDHAASKIIEDAAREWLVQAIDGFAAERAFLTKLTVAAGPMHSHSGQEKVSALLASQSKNFEMLSTSDRKGCAAGAAITFVLDWQTSRPLLDGVALLLGITPPECQLPARKNTAKLAGALAENTRIERAMTFGGDQLIALQRGLWQIIAARHAEIREMG
ncbi:MAG: hypothetical protein V3V15_07285 [Sphingorhabdus sp.]